MFKALESMMDETTKMDIGSGGDDMPDDMPDEGLFESCMELHEDHPDMMECHEMCNTMEDMEHLHDTIDQHGVSKSMMAFANKDSVLSMCMPAYAACEALEGDAPAGSPEAEAAKTSTMEKIKEISAAWFKKAWDVVSGWGAKIGAFAHACYSRVEMAAKFTAGKTFDAAKAAAEHISAHPIAYITGVIAVAASVTAVIVGLWTGTLPTDAESYKEWMRAAGSKLYKIADKAGDDTGVAINKVYDAVANAGTSTKDAIKSGTAAALGYTKEGFDHLVEAVKGLYGENGPVMKLSNYFKSGAEKVLESVKEHGGEAYRYSRKAVAWLMQQTAHLWSRAPATTMKYFMQAMKMFKKFYVNHVAVAA